MTLEEHGLITNRQHITIAWTAAVRLGSEPMLSCGNMHTMNDATDKRSERNGGVWDG